MTLEKKPVGNDDSYREDEAMIDELPDSLLCEILYNLPTKDVVKTSLLCRRWRDLWKSVPRLDLEFNGFVDFDKYDFFNRFIDLNGHDLRLQRIMLRYVGYTSNAYNEATINTVIKKNIQHLEVNGHTIYDRVRVPPTIYTSCERLVSLKLYCAQLPILPETVCLPCLKIMDLQRILFVGTMTMDMLISVCPALETLTVDMMYGVKVSSKSLLSFCLTRYINVFQTTEVVMQTPKLKYLKLNRHCIERIIMNDLSSIVKLDLVDLMNFGESYPYFLTVISRVRDLTISSDILLVNRKFSASESVPQFPKLSTLSVKEMKDFGFWEYLLLFLGKCPNLKSLVMEFPNNSYGINFFDVPQCVLSSLEYVEVRSKHMEDMKKIVSYFMANSRALKKLTLRLDEIEERDYVNLNELLALPRQSPTCEVVVRSRTFGTCKPFSLFSCADGFS